MSLFRLAMFGFLAIAVTACAGPAPTRAKLDSSLIAAIRVTSVSVDVSAIGEYTTGRAVRAEAVKESLENIAGIHLVGLGGGTRDATAEITISSAKVISAGQSYVIGGESVFVGTVSLVESKTGETILNPVKLSSGGGGWVPGGLLAVATMDDINTELNQLSDRFVNRAATIIAGPQ